MEELYKQFQTEVCAVSEELDPGQEQDWYSLSLGWALAKGLTVDRAHDFAVFSRYTKHYR